MAPRAPFGLSLSKPWCSQLLVVLALLVASPATLAAPHRCLSDCTPRIGIVSAFGAEADILVAQTRGQRTWRVNGNRFTTGMLRGNPVVVVLSGVSMINATMVTQLMLDHFRIERLIMSGIAGGIDPARHVGDVLIPERWTMPMEVYWSHDGSTPAPCGAVGDLACLGLKLATQADGQPRPDFRLPTPDGGALPTGLFMRENFVMTARSADKQPPGEWRFDYDADPHMLAVARRIQPELRRCGPKDANQCVSTQPQLVVGGRGISGTAFLANPQYRAYVFQTLAAQVVDMETAALAHVAHANQVPFIAMRSLSDLAGAHEFNQDVGALFRSGLAETNEAAVTLAFLEAWRREAHSPKPASKPEPARAASPR
ncbi:MAG TPA: 5'-methylthioadenosine/S-adenosylhomocysteine nucleosidase [Burkholderiaceae bacterium]|nr:5'-methylthioadenosine/S-adenosylhomocysteine nucleosidase [Burkholderiaceae bacterium]